MKTENNEISNIFVTGTIIGDDTIFSCENTMTAFVLSNDDNESPVEIEYNKIYNNNE